ncbi:hypothetical protein RRG08_037072 [Elysia crispata]|uniref:Uncharacterized protein n=1 Tax=Elysia crispata TaxID=231223 RepID=A0AAE1DMU3_9GAST|nr:hypothetical protein RRG08_037072 [Elysia crispata]
MNERPLAARPSPVPSQGLCEYRSTQQIDNVIKAGKSPVFSLCPGELPPSPLFPQDLDISDSRPPPVFLSGGETDVALQKAGRKRGRIFGI